MTRRSFRVVLDSGDPDILRTMHFIILTIEQAEVAAFRFGKQANSPTRVMRHFRREGDLSRVGICRALRRIEWQYGIDLGKICYKFLEKETRPTPQVQRQVMDYIAGWRDRRDGAQDLIVSVDRVLEIDRLAEGETEWEWATSLDS